MAIPRIEIGLLEPKEAVAFFRQKGYRIAFSHEDVWREANQAAFTVAKVAQMDLLADIRAAVDSALVNGTTFETFAKQLKPEMIRRGWWGKGTMTDPTTGEVKQVQLGSIRRLKTIYDTNLRTAHSEGQWTRIQDSVDTLPYLMWDHTPSRYERKEHAAWDGLILHVTHAFWLTHNTPCGYGCKCRRQQLTADQAAAAGGPGQAPPELYRTYTNRRTGETIEVPEGVHPSFAYPPGGRLKNLGQHLANRIEAAPTHIGTHMFVTAREHVLPLIQQDYAQWVTAIEGRGTKGLGGRRVIDAFTPDVVTKLSRLGVTLETCAVSVDQREITHLFAEARKGKKALPREFVYSMPKRLGSFTARFYDSTVGREGIWYVWHFGGDDYARVVVRPNFSLKRETYTNAIRNGQMININDLKGPHLTLIDGTL